MALNSCEMWSNGIYIAFVSKNLQKSPSGWGLCPQTPIAIGGWGLCPQTPVSDTFEYTSLLNTSFKLDFYTFQQLVFALSLYQNPGKVPSGYGFRSSILRYLCPTKNHFFENFWWRHCVWFVVWAPSPIKNPGYAYAALHVFFKDQQTKAGRCKYRWVEYFRNYTCVSLWFIVFLTLLRESHFVKLFLFHELYSFGFWFEISEFQMSADIRF